VRRTLALFRVSTARFVGEGRYQDLIEELCSASREFQAWWRAHDLDGSPRGAKVINHPLVGPLLFYPNPLQVAPALDAWMLVSTRGTIWLYQ
jgi:hypothetical protein